MNSDTSKTRIIACPNCGAKNRIDPSKASRQQPVCGRCGAPLSGARKQGTIVVTDDTFARKVLGVKDIPVLVDFWAPWCGPCKMLAPTLQQIARDSDNKYRIAKLNIDENPRTASQFRVSSIPAMLIFKNGKKIDELIGPMPTNKILAALNRAR